MSDKELIKFLLELSEDDRITDKESDLLVAVVQVWEKKSRRKEKALEAFRAAVSLVGNI